MKKPLPMYRLTRFDYEGMLFVNFPVEAWVSGAAEKAVEDTIREMDGEFAALTPGSVYIAIHAIQAAPFKLMKPWEVEALRMKRHPELTARFPPYWKQNGGSHVPGEAVGWEFGDEPAAADGWDFGEDTQKNCTQEADGWDFDAEPETSRGKSASSASSGWDF